MSCFPEPHYHSKNEIKVDLSVSHYATKSDWKNATGVGKSIFAKETMFTNE